MDFLADLNRYRRAGGDAEFTELYPCLGDKTSTTGVEPHYFHQGIWAFKRIQKSGAVSHVDVGSSVNWVGMLTTITEVTFIDIRPLELELEGYAGKRGSILEMPYPDNSVSSLSCMHVAEHVGLGRYGDPIDPEGTLKACRELARVLAPGGQLYFSLPVGRSRVCFNAHRVHSPEQILAFFSNLKLENFALVDDQGKFVPDAPIQGWEGLDFGCGMFHFSKG